MESILLILCVLLFVAFAFAFGGYLGYKQYYQDLRIEHSTLIRKYSKETDLIKMIKSLDLTDEEEMDIYSYVGTVINRKHYE